ncbi:MAG: hypothetical protein II155_05650 [Clostridia bacterium]|nr:hypothetical protein [Clostridia bacterium]
MKKRISKAEYVKLLRISKTSLRRELRRPTEKQDAELVSECVENIVFCEKELAALRSERAHARGALPVLRRIGTAFLAFLVFFAAFATVSEAAGFRVWTAIIKRDAGYLRVDYVPDPTAAPAPVYAEWEDGEYSFFSREDFDSRLMQDGFASFSSEFGEFRFIEGSIRSMKKDYYATYTLNSPASCVRVRMIAKANEPEPVAVWGMDGDRPFTEAEFNGIPVTYQTDDDGYVFATWQARGCIFCASLYEPEIPAEQILEMIVG